MHYQRLAVARRVHADGHQHRQVLDGPAPRTLEPDAVQEDVDDPVTGAATQVAYSDGRTEKHFYDPDDGSLGRFEIWKAGILAWWRTIAYDEERRTATVATPEGTVSYQYNEYGELTELKTSWGQTTDYQYDCFGRMTAVASNKLGTSGGTVRYAYDPATGRKSEVTRPNGVTTHYDYDWMGNVRLINHHDDSHDLLRLTYARDNRGIITTLKEKRDDEATTVTWTYAYDGAKRLTEADRDNGTSTETWGYTYDDAGNRTVKSHDDGTPTTVYYAYNEIGQMLSDGTTTYRYDAYGNLEYEIRASDGDYLRQYVWDGENHLLAVKLWTAGVASTATAPDTTVAMGYDDQGGRVARTQTDGSGETATVDKGRYLTDYGNPTGYSQVLEQLDSSATSAEKDFIYGADLLAQADSGGGPAYLLGDHLGSTRLLTDAAGGAITNTAFDYSPYGEPLGTSGGSLTTYPHAFTGQWRDETLGMQFHRARWVAPYLSRWLSVDQSYDFPDNLLNRFGYCGMNPVSNSDKNGFMTLGETASVAATAGVLSGGLAGITDFFLGLKDGLSFGASFGHAAVTFAKVGFITFVSTLLTIYTTTAILGFSAEGALATASAGAFKKARLINSFISFLATLLQEFWTTDFSKLKTDEDYAKWIIRVGVSSLLAALIAFVLYKNQADSIENMGRYSKDARALSAKMANSMNADSAV